MITYTDTRKQGRSCKDEFIHSLINSKRNSPIHDG